MDSGGKPSFMNKLATQIVDKRNFIFLIFIIVCIFCVFSRGWVKINDDLTVYLGADTETRIGLDIMDAEFAEYATAKVMAANLTYDRAAELLEVIKGIDGVHDVAFDNSEEHYKAASALYSVTFNGGVEDPVSISAINAIRERLSDYDIFVSSDVGNPMEQTIESEMTVVLAIAVLIIISVLLFTSKTYMEIPVLLMTFGAAALMNMGTNYWFGTVSFVTNSIAVVLQLALAIDYAIILCHRYSEERAVMEPREAVITALSKAIPEISASSLTTVSGLVALTLMDFRLGYDMGIVLIKAIITSLLSVFFLMPGLLMLFSKAIDKTPHRNFVPSIDFLGRLTVKTRYVVPPIFLLMVVAAFFCANRCPYVYGYSTLDTVKQNETKIADKAITGTFGSDNFLALVVPSGDYDKETALLGELDSYPEIKSTMGLCNIEAMSGYTLTSKLTARQFSELTDLDVEVAQTLYAAYAVNDAAYGRIIADMEGYKVPLIDMFLYLYAQKQEGYVNLDKETDDMLEDLHSQLTFAKSQLGGENYSRFVIHLNLPEESRETFDFQGTIHQVAAKYYDEAYLVGETVKDYDLSKSFSGDNLLISILSALFVVAVLLFTFRSVGLPVLLILVIQSSIWINFSVPYISGKNLFFIAYLIVSAIQMGANIDYAIVISSRYMELKKTMPIKEAMVETLNQAFPTIITSGMMLASAGLLIGRLTSENTISSIGTCLGRGTIISIILVMCVLPQILLLGDIIIQRTAFQLKKPELTRLEGSTIQLRGRVRGQLSGFVDAEVRGVFRGSLNALVESGAAEILDAPAPEESEDGDAIPRPGEEESEDAKV